MRAHERRSATVMSSRPGCPRTRTKPHRSSLAAGTVLHLLTRAARQGDSTHRALECAWLGCSTTLGGRCQSGLSCGDGMPLAGLGDGGILRSGSRSTVVETRDPGSRPERFALADGGLCRGWM